jgi:asparagine N-glycosylation enzyme membrane subunit Stt3
MAGDTIEINTKSLRYLKKYFLKNNFVLVFSLLALFSLILGFSGAFGFSLGIGFLIQLTNLFSSTMWIFLALMLILSSFLAYHEKWKLMFLPIMLWLLFTTAMVRTSNISGLVNAATGEPVFGPDLDPYLYLRNAIEIDEGRNLGEIDNMRYAPLGAPSYLHTNIMPWAIIGIYQIINLFGEYSITEAGIITPVIFFLISIIGFFLFVYLLFSFKISKKKALTGATIASFLYAFVPSMLHRTIAGIPEIESLGMALFWFAFFFFILAWKQEFKRDSIIKNKKLIIYGLLAGIFTGAMSWTWGGYRYIYMTLALATFLGFLFNIEKKKSLTIFSSFLITGLVIEFLRLKSVTTIIMSFNDTGFAFGVLLIMWVNYLIFGTKLRNNSLIRRVKEKTKLPNNIISLIITLIFGILFITVLRPTFIINLISTIIERLLYPFGRSRVGLTIAENRAPYFTEVLGTFGNLIWLFLAGLVLIFRESIKHFSKKKRLTLNFFFILFVATFIFSRISPGHMFDGENLISRIIYLGGLAIFGIILLFTYINSYLKKDEKTFEDFSKISFGYLILISFSFWGIVSMRGAVRLFFIIAPIIIFISTYFFIKIFEYRKSEDDLIRLTVWLLILVNLFILGSIFIGYTQGTIITAPQIVPSAYNQQWHHAMNWVEQNTPENSIFTHWWDYGYWVQTLGKRPTVSDGGHFVGWWDHTIGRYLLTTSRPETALSLMKTHEVSYLLIDSSDVGKYSAFSTIGSDMGGKDRQSWIPVMPIDPSQTQESNGRTTVIFVNGQVIDGDIVYIDETGKEIFLPAERAGLAAITLEYGTQNNQISLSQPKGIFIYNNQRYDIPLRYLYYNGEIIEFPSGIEAMARIIPGLEQGSQGVNINPIGAAIYLSEKTKDTLFSQLYLLDDPENKYPTVTIAHVEDDFIVKSLKQQGLNLGDFLYYQGLRGPIKIWEINYPENILTRKEFLWQIDPEGKWGALDNLDFTR